MQFTTEAVWRRLPSWLLLQLWVCASACSVYDSELLVAHKPDAVKAGNADSGSNSLTPVIPPDAEAQGPGPDETPDRPDAGSAVRCGDGIVTGAEKCDI